MSEFKSFQLWRLPQAFVVELTESAFVDGAQPQDDHAMFLHELRRELVDLVKAETPTRLVVDFQRVPSCSSEGISIMLRVRDHIVGNGGQLKLCGMSKVVREVYKIAFPRGQLFDIYDDANAALAAFTP